MAIELFFRCPRTLTKLRSGALGNFLEGFCLWLLKAGFSRSYIGRHLFNVSRLNSFLGGADARPCRPLSPQDITAFFEAYPARCCHRGSLQAHLQNVHASINRFVTYLLSQGLFETPIADRRTALSAVARRLLGLDAPRPGLEQLGQTR